MSVEVAYRWDGRTLESPPPRGPSRIGVADSWLVSEGTALAIGLHRERFTRGIAKHRHALQEPDAFWDAAIARIPRAGVWFPRVELVTGNHETALDLRLRSAPELGRSVSLATHRGADPRTDPRLKGPDLEAMSAIRIATRGADDVVLLSPEGWVVETTSSALLWWRGNILCGPSANLDRIDSVTAKSILGLAAGLGIDTVEESVTAAELDGTELWAVNALHGIRIVTSWIAGPALAQLPGRLGAWRSRLHALRQPL